MADKRITNLSQAGLDLKLIDLGNNSYAMAVQGGGIEGYIGLSGSPAESISASVTRPADTTQYAAGDVVTSSPAAVLTFSGAGRVNGGSGIVIDALLIDSANQTTKPNLELWLFSQAPAIDDDNAAFTPTDAELANLVGIVQFTTGFVGDATAGAGGNCVLPSERTYLPVFYECAAAVTALYGVLVARNTYTPVSGEVFSVKLKVAQN